MSNLTFNDQSGETHTHIEGPAAPMAIGSATSDQSGETHPRVESSASDHPELYNPTTNNQWELANPHIGSHMNLHNGVKTEHKLDTKTRDTASLEKHVQSSFPPSEIISTESCPTSVPNSGNKNHTQGGETQSSDSSSSRIGNQFFSSDLVFLGPSQVMETCPAPTTLTDGTLSGVPRGARQRN